MYLRVQHLYRERVERDVAAVEADVRQLLGRLGKPADSISHDTIRLYCRHARHLRCVRWEGGKAGPRHGASGRSACGADGAA